MWMRKLEGGDAFIDFTDIPTPAELTTIGFGMRFLCRVRSDSTDGGGPVAWQLTVNGIADSVYTTVMLPAAVHPFAPGPSTGSGILLSAPNLDPSFNLPFGLDASASASRFTVATIDIPFFANPETDQVVIATVAGLIDTAGAECSLYITGRVPKSALASEIIDRVTFQVASGNFAADSRIIATVIAGNHWDRTPPVPWRVDDIAI